MTRPQFEDPDILNSCIRKKRIPDKESARRRAHQVGLAAGLRLFYYGCTVCGGWHLTRLPIKQRKRGP